MRPLEVFMRFVAYSRQQITEENRLRTVCFYLVAPHWDTKRNGQLKWPWQIWEIPEIDGETVEKIGYTTIKPLTDKEKRLVKRLEEKNERFSHR